MSTRLLSLLRLNLLLKFWAKPRASLLKPPLITQMKKISLMTKKATPNPQGTKKTRSPKRLRRPLNPRNQRKSSKLMTRTLRKRRLKLKYLRLMQPSILISKT